MHPSPALRPEPSLCWGSPRLPGWHRGAWVGQGGDKSHSECRGQASWQEWESCLCAAWRAITVSVVPSQALALALAWEPEHRFVRRAGGLNYQPAAGQLQAEGALIVPGKPLAPLPKLQGGGLVWYLVLGSNLLWLSRNEGDLMAVPWGLVAVGISCHTPRAWARFTFFPPLCCIATSPWIHPHCLSLAYLFMQKPMAAGTIPFWWPGAPSTGCLQHGSCALIKAAPDKSRTGISPQGVLDHVKVAPVGACQAS